MMNVTRACAAPWDRASKNMLAPIGKAAVTLITVKGRPDVPKTQAQGVFQLLTHLHLHQHRPTRATGPKALPSSCS